MNVGVVPVVFLSRFFRVFSPSVLLRTETEWLAQGQYLGSCCSFFSEWYHSSSLCSILLSEEKEQREVKKYMESSLFCMSDACKDTELLILLQLPFWLFNSPLVAASGEDNFFSSSWQHPLCSSLLYSTAFPNQQWKSERSVPRKLWQLFQWWRLGLPIYDDIAV